MKTVNKYILASCVFCYFAGIYLIATKMGIMRLISRYGLSRTLDEWPADFPSLTLIYVCLAVYTLLFAIITYIIYRNIESNSKEVEVLQQKTSTLHNYSESLSLVISRYNRISSEKNSSDKTLAQRLQLLEKKVSSLPASVLNNSNAGNKIIQIVSELDDEVSNMETTAESDFAANSLQLKNAVEHAIDEIQRLKTNSVTIK